MANQMVASKTWQSSKDISFDLRIKEKGVTIIRTDSVEASVF